jgi:DNA-binding CsgD family transcriptional regulator
MVLPNNPISQNIFTLLTEAQLECLQLVRRRKTAKQIARTLNITHHAVEQRLKSARRKLGVETTAEAVDLLEAAERAAYGDTVYGSPDVARLDVDWAPPDLSPPMGGDSGREVMTAFSPVAERNAVEPSGSEKLKEMLLGDAGDMSWQHRLVFMAAVALVTITIVILLISFIEGLSRLDQS